MTDYERLPGSPAVLVTRDQPARMRDGVTLLADVYRPESDELLPVLLCRTPYGKAGAQSDYAYAHPAFYAARGYQVVVQDVRGRGASEGDFVPFLHEAEDGHDAIAWAAALDGANGQVGTYGFSYAGFCQLLSAPLRPPGLITMAPAMTPSQAYDGFLYYGGAPALDAMTWWAAFLGVGDALRREDTELAARLHAALADPDGLAGALPPAAHPLLTHEAVPYLHDWLAHPNDDAWWRRWSVEERYAEIGVPALHVAGHYDAFSRGSIRNFRGLREKAATAEARAGQKLLLAPLGHMPWTPLGGARPEAGANVIDDWTLRWFDHYLKGRRTDVLDSPVTAYVTGAGWRDLDDWPEPGKTLHLRSDGRANGAAGDGWLSTEPPSIDEPPDRVIANPLAPVPSEGGHGLTPPRMGPMPQTQREASRMVLCYTGEAAEMSVDYIGDVELDLHAASTTNDADLTARLLLVSPDGASVNLAEGVIRCSRHHSLEQPYAIMPDAVERYRLSLGPVAVRIPPGARLRVAVAGSDFPLYGRNLNSFDQLGQGTIADAVVATLTVLHDATHLSILRLPETKTDRRK